MGGWLGAGWSAVCACVPGLAAASQKRPAAQSKTPTEYSTLYPLTPAPQVGTLYSPSNVWVNVQPSGAPWDIAWDLGQASEWRPFFGAVLPPRELAAMQVRSWRVKWVCVCMRACVRVCVCVCVCCSSSPWGAKWCPLACSGLALCFRALWCSEHTRLRYG